MSKVVLFGGTTEGRLLADYCSRHEIETLVCVTSDYGADLLPESPWIKVHKGAMEAEEMEEVLFREKPALVLDGTHPYAAVASGNVRKACLSQGLPYVRVLRESSEGAKGFYGQSSGERDILQGAEGGKTVWVDTAREAAEYLAGTKGRVLLTTGSKELPVFAGIEGFGERVYVRVLPSEKAIAQCRELEVESSRIIAMQGPFTLEMNMAVLNMIKAEYMVTKESGAAGGFAEKMEAARRTGVTAVVIGRPRKEEGICFKEAIKLLDPYGKRCPRKIYLVGIGMGGPGQLTGEAISCIREADGVAGARRMLESVESFCAGKEIRDTYRPEEIYRWLEDNPQMEKAAVVYSGDPGFYSGAQAMRVLLEQHPGEYETIIIPGVSTMSCFCARLKTTWEDVYPGSLHGRSLEVEQLLETHEKVFLLMGNKDSVRELCRRLTHRGLGNTRMWVGMSLSYPDEQIVWGTARELEEKEFHGLCAVLLERAGAGENI